MQAKLSKGMYIATFSAWILSIPLLVFILFRIQDFDGIISATYTNNWAEYLVQLIGENGAVAILSLLWVDNTCATASCFMSAQRVTYAILVDHTLPGSKKLSRKMAVNAAFLVFAFSAVIMTAVIGSTVAFSAITVAAIIATNTSHLFPMVARHTIGRKLFQPVKWNLGKSSPYLATIASLYIMFLFVVLLLPQLYPVTGDTFNYAPVMIGAITITSLAGWFLPFGLGEKYWFKGPARIIPEQDLANAGDLTVEATKA